MIASVLSTYPVIVISVGGKSDTRVLWLDTRDDGSKCTYNSRLYSRVFIVSSCWCEEITRLVISKGMFIVHNNKECGYLSPPK